VPLAVILLYSFLSKRMYGGVLWEFSLEAYKSLSNPAFLKVSFATLILSLTSSFITVALALPSAYYIARSKHKNVLLFLIIVPFWTNFLIRIYAWMAILGNAGYVNQMLLSFGWMSEPAQLLYNGPAVCLVMVYTYLPFAILPLYSTIEKFDFSLIEAACDLGAGKIAAHRKVLLPNIRSGITAAVLFTLIPALGQYAIPQLIGGKDSYMLGNIIARELTVAGNWPLAASISVVLTILTMLGILVFLWLNRPHSVEKLRA
jgi:spermidine/putrescine transport system permease protein